LALLKKYRKLLKNAQRLLEESLWAIIKGYRKAVPTQGGRIAQWLLANTWKFPFISSAGAAFLFVSIKNQRQVKNFLETLSGSSPKYFLSLHTNLSQTRTGSTVPLNTNLFLPAGMFPQIYIWEH
jgi:hypothetical protein